MKFLMVLSMVFPIENVLATGEGRYDKSELLQIIREAERREEIPIGLLESIARIESGMHEFAINAGGKSSFAASKEEALRIVKQALDYGMTNIDIGIMQLNWRWHNKEFASLNEMFTPSKNIEYAAKLLRNLHDRYGDWHKAVRHYHSNKEVHNKKYSRKVVIGWLNG